MPVAASAHRCYDLPCIRTSVARIAGVVTTAQFGRFYADWRQRTQEMRSIRVALVRSEPVRAKPAGCVEPSAFAVALPGASLAALLCLFPAALQAGNGFAYTIRGFGTFGASGTDTDRLEFVRNNTQEDGVTRSWGVNIDSRLGLQLDVDFSESLHGAIQWVARDHAGNFFEQNLDWAFLRWHATPDLDFRIGRLGTDIFMLSDYRNVGYAYPWIRPPHEFYSGQMIYHFDGADVAKKFSLGEGFLTLKGFGGYSFLQFPVGQSITVDQGFTVAGSSLSYELGNWRGRVGYALAHSEQEWPLQPLFAVMENPLVDALWPGARSLVDDLSGQGKDLHYVSVGLAYDDGTWLTQAEGSYVNSDLASFPSVASGYLSLGRRFGPVTVFTLLGIAKSTNRHFEVPGLQIPVPELVTARSITDSLLNDNDTDEKSVSLGVRWDVYENIALKAQWSHFWLGEGGALLWSGGSGGEVPENVNVWSLGVDFIF